MQATSHSFIRKFFRDPQGTGAVLPATRTLANSVDATARAACLQHGRPRLIELGAGTGALTQCLAGLNPVVVEKDEAWAALLRLRFPALEVRQQCAIETLRGLLEPTGVVSSIPLLNNPQSSELKSALEAKYREGIVKFCVLYTYGWSNPLAGSMFRLARRASFVPRSLPPAHVWLYQ
jgi:phosphatidylethanolamine/phosphatidyl-N-methylethanolamine N-methyltransferase